MVPELTSETQFRLRAHELEIRQAAEVRPQALADPMVQLLWQVAHQESIIRKARSRIMELEARDAVGQREERRAWQKMAREMYPVSWWVRVLWMFYPLMRFVLKPFVRRRPRR